MSERSEGRRLIRRFAVGTLVAFLATWIGVAAIMARSVRRQEEAGATLHARTVALEVVRPLLRPSDLTEPVTGARYDHLRAIVEARVLSDGRVVRVKVWGMDGTVLFSDNRAQVGEHFGPEDEFEEIAAGEVVSDISNVTADENLADRKLGSKLFETYVPVRLTKDGPVVGAIELYQGYAYVQGEVNQLLGSLALAFGVGLGVLYLVLMPLVFTTAKRLRERNERLAKQAEEHP